MQYSVSESFYFFATYRESHHQAHNSDVPSQYLSCSVCNLFFFFLNLECAVSNLGFAQQCDSLSNTFACTVGLLAPAEGTFISPSKYFSECTF